MHFSFSIVLYLALLIGNEGAASSSSDKSRGLKADKKTKDYKKTKDNKKAKGAKKDKKLDKKKNIERRGLCVIGGGAAGAYTAYEAQKRGYDTVLFEPKSELGGNCEYLQVPSVIDPTQTYDVNAAVVIFSPTETVKSFFDEMGAITTELPVSEHDFVYNTAYGTVPSPGFDQTSMMAALTEYSMIVNSPPYAGVYANPLIPLPDFDILTEEQVVIMLEPFGSFLQNHPGVQPLVPVMSSLIQGLGPLLTQPMWEILRSTPPSWISRLFMGTFLHLPDGCQDIYDTLQARMIEEDSTSVMLNTGVDRIARMDGKVMLDVTTATGNKSNYECDDAIIAFRPDGLDETTLNPIGEEEKTFFSDLSYNGYIPSVWNLDIGPALQAVGVGPNQTMIFFNASIVDVGIVTIQMSGVQADYPWIVFYQPSEPADTPEKLAAVKDAITAELTAVGFENPETIFIKNHKYGVKPTTLESLKAWVPFFQDANYNDDDHLYWTGSVVSGDASEWIWEYSKQLLDEVFPAT